MGDEATKTVKLVLSGKLGYEEDISLAQATRILALINDVEAAPTGPEKPGGSRDPDTSAVNESPWDSPRAALDQVKASKYSQKITVLAAYFLGDNRTSGTFTYAVIKPLFQQAGETSPGYAPRELAAAVAQGLIATSGTAGDEYFITKKGNDAITAGVFNNMKAAGSSRPASSKRPRKPTEMPEVFANIDPLPSFLVGYPNYHDLKTDRDRLLWVLAMAKQTDAIEGLPNKAIVWATDRLGKGIASNNINSYYKALQKLSYVNRSTQTQVIRLTPQGDAYLKSIGSPASK